MCLHLLVLSKLLTFFTRMTPGMSHWDSILCLATLVASFICFYTRFAFSSCSSSCCDSYNSRGGSNNNCWLAVAALDLTELGCLLLVWE